MLKCPGFFDYPVPSAIRLHFLFNRPLIAFFTGFCAEICFTKIL